MKDIRYSTRDGQIGVNLMDVKFKCTKCQEWKDGGEFGLREVPRRNGIRVICRQPVCKGCR